MKNIIYKISFVLLIVIIGCLSYSICNTLNNKENKNMEINIENILNNRDSSFAIQIQNDDYTWSEAKDRTTWPDSTTYTYAGTECIDSEGAEIKSTDVLTFDETTYTATVNTKNSVYCTLFFAKGRPALEVMHKYSGTTLGGGKDGTTAVFELIRYKGTKDEVTNNYICFGTNNADTCLSEPDTYMYRIIGIQGSNNDTLKIPKDSLKIIKATKYGGNVKWNNSSGATWDTASVNTSTLNTTFYNTISETNSGVNWRKLILGNTEDYNVEKHFWYIGDDTNNASTTEKTTKSTTSNPIGLMYKSDFVNAYQINTTENWLFITNGWSEISKDTGWTNSAEWTMSRQKNVYAYVIDSAGRIDNYGMETSSFPIRPVFYLVSGIALVGEGSTTNPFIITNKA